MSTKKKPTVAAPAKRLTQVEQHNATMDAMGYAIGRAMPLFSEFPPTNFESTGLLRLKLEHLYKEILATPQEGMLHISQALIINGMMMGLAAAQNTQPIGGAVSKRISGTLEPGSQ